MQISSSPRKPSLFQVLVVHLKYLTKWGWHIFGGIALVVGFVAIFYPRISVSPASSLDPKSALLTPFVISNEGNIPLTNIVICLGLNKIKTQTKHGHIEHVSYDGPFSALFCDPETAVSVLLPSEKYTVLSPLQFNPNGSVAFADIAIIVNFNPAFFPIKMKKVFRFITTTGADGKLYWYAQPLSKTKTALSHLYTK